MTTQFLNPFAQVFDPSTGRPLFNAKLYFGTRDGSPATNPAQRVNVYAVQDNGSELLLAQPVRTNAAGYPVVGGSVKQLRVDYGDNYEISYQVMSSSDIQLFYSPRVDRGITDTAVTSIKLLDSVNRVDGQQYDVSGFYANSYAGGGVFVWRASEPKSSHNGVTVFAPEAIAVWNGTPSDIGALLYWSGSGSGVWVRLQPISITPQLAGAVSNGVVDCTQQIQKCVSFLGSFGGGKLSLPAGTYILSGSIDMSGQAVVIEGDSRFATIFKQKSLGSKILNITGNFCGVKSASFIYDGTPASGAIAIYVTSGYVTLSDFAIRSCYEGVFFNGGNAVAGKVTDFEILDYEAVGLHAANLNDLFVDNFIMNAGNTSRGIFGGIRLENKVEAFICSRGDILVGKYSLTMDAASNTLGNRPAYNNFTDVFFDSASDLNQINKCVETDFVGCWFSGGRLSEGLGNAGVAVSNSRSIRFTNTRFFNCGGSGLVVRNTSTDITLMNCKAESNSVTIGEGVTHGFQFEDGTKQFKIIGCTASNGLYTGKQGFGIQIGYGCDDFIITDNNLLGNFTGSMSDLSGVSANKTISGNLGYKTRSKGVATIAAGNTTVVVNHGLNVTPQPEDIMLTMRTSNASSIDLYVSDINSTQFTIRTQPAPTSGIQVAWNISSVGA